VATPQRPPTLRFFPLLGAVDDLSEYESVLMLEAAQRFLFDFLHLDGVTIQRILFIDCSLFDRAFGAYVES
jgi:hypothetical protein